MPSTSECPVMAQPLRFDLPSPPSQPAVTPARRSTAALGRRRRGRVRYRQVALGLAVSAAGATILAALVQIPQRFDGLLLVSNAIANVIGGLNRLAVGLLQLAGVLAVALLAVLALLLLVGGLVRIVRALTGRPVRARGAGATARPVATRTTGT